MSHCQLVRGNRVGVECLGRATLRMTACTITEFRNQGIVLRDADAGSTIRETQIAQCGREGILLQGETGALIEACQIQHNHRHGIRGVAGAVPTVVASIVTENGGIGISVEHQWKSAIRQNTVSNNRLGGVVARARCSGEITGNLIENNGVAGLLLSLACSPVVTGNQFVKNEGPGLLLQEDSQPQTLQDNQFIENAQAAIRNEGRATVNARQNWWGATTATAIAVMIQDQRTNDEYGIVEFDPFLSEPPAADVKNSL